ncbi:dihydroorotase [Petrotoga sp. 9PWA.NaAc.5.4]|uniref:dihydroorotase n=1 Tax=Petrotoga sp. 9PWA.NaAc.5.4 TaxID=1434328 RepID=UPI000CBBBB70|nr:dihydroorotase [Petrotoga sp. 9PWA.NaAc.5.4]PNR92457.1 dihydroorotase [Petrotoga sp. 9PWA.NaAc.5.4]
MKTLIKNANVVSHSTNGIKNIVIEDKIISKIAEDEIEEKFDKIIDTGGKTLIPGIIDMHVHLREPGFEHREDLESGLKAALHGGITLVGVMPNTEPAIDNPFLVEYLKLKSEKLNLAKLLPIGSVTKNREGKELTDMLAMGEKGVIAFSDDGNPVEDSCIMLKALQLSKKIGLPIINHCEVKELSRNGHVREGYYSKHYGIEGIPDIAESVMVARDIELAKYCKTHVHIAHLSTKASVDLIRKTKKEGVMVTSEVTHNHLLFTDKDLSDYSTNKKVNPPLPTQKDQLELLKGLQEGVIDIIVTDHAPYSKKEKQVEFQSAPYGISGVETLLSSLILLSQKYDINFIDLIKKVTYYPAKIFGIENVGDIKEGYFADLVILDTEKFWVVDELSLLSKGKNTPFLGERLPGVVEKTFVEGEIKYDIG